MTKPKFTTGPWLVEIHKRYYGPQKHTEVHTSNGALIADVSPWKAHKANAHLIAAAPEMYAELERIEDVLEDSGDCGEISLDRIKSILRKARGESEVEK